MQLPKETHSCLPLYSDSNAFLSFGLVQSYSLIHCFWLSHQSSKNFNLPRAQLKHLLSPIPHTDPMGFGMLHACCIQTGHKARFLPSVLSRWERRLTCNAGFVFWWPQKKGFRFRALCPERQGQFGVCSIGREFRWFLIVPPRLSSFSLGKEDTVNKI